MAGESVRREQVTSLDEFHSGRIVGFLGDRFVRRSIRLEEISQAHSPNKSILLMSPRGVLVAPADQAGTALVVLDPEFDIDRKMFRDECIPAAPTLERKGVVHVYLVPKYVFEIFQVIEVVSHTEIEIGRERSPKLCKGQDGDVGVRASSLPSSSRS